jgi:hypothetical protein
MSAAAGPYGFIPVRHTSGQNRADPYPIQNNAGTGYATSIFKGDFVILNTAGYIVIGTTGADLLGSFQGCEYQGADGITHVSNYWPASTVLFNTSVVPTAWVVTDPATVFSVQADGSVAITAIGDQADLVTGTGSTVTGGSTWALNHTLAGAGAQGQFRIIGLDGDINNAWGDAYTKVLVQQARPQYVAAKVAI